MSDKALFFSVRPETVAKGFNWYTFDGLTFIKLNKCTKTPGDTTNNPG